MFCDAWPDLKFLLFTSHIPQLLYYSHIPTAIISLFFGSFVLLRNKNLVSKILFLITGIFSFWVFLGLLLWTNPDSRVIMFFWSLYGVLYGLIYILSFYFVYVFVEKRDMSFLWKIILILFFIPVILLSSTKYNLSTFDIPNCEAIESFNYLNYYHFFGVAIFLLILIFSLVKYFKAEREFKKQILLLTIGIGFFLLSFFATGYVASLIDNFELEQYGLFSATFFIGVLAYMIVKFKAFDIKLLGVQALVIALIGAVFFLFFLVGIDDIKVVIVLGATILIATFMGIYLVRSVKQEVKRKEELQEMSNKLSQANDQLRKLDNAKSEFISIASHQLRTPLTAVKGFVSLLLEGSYGKVDPKQQDVLNKVYTSNDRLIHLVEDLLNVSRMESGRMEFKLEPTDLKAVCKEVMDTFYVRAKEMGLYLEYKPTADELPMVTIDGIKMREVIFNLVDNAIKYCPKGGVTLRVDSGISSQFVMQNTPKAGRFGSEPQTSEKKVVRVTISDTGIGIPQTELPYLFAKFSRGKDISRLNTGGTGLGLYVGKAIVEANGSRIWAESDGEGKGSRFIVEIPVEQSEEIIKKWS